jgi:hypothetical protein
MRGWDSGLGARISSIALVILSVFTEIHWADNLLNESDLTIGDALFGLDVVLGLMHFG